MRTLRTRIVRTLPVLALLAALLPLLAPAPARAATVCADELGAVTINDHLVVPEGESCFLRGTTVTGSIEVEGGSLDMFGAEVRGDVEAEEYRELLIDDSVIGGDVDATGGIHTHIEVSRIGGSVEVSGIDGSDIEVQGNTIRGHLTIEENLLGLDIVIGTNTVGGHLTFEANSALDGIFVFANEVGGSLECADNDPAPTLDGNAPNVAAGGKEGQCASL